MQTAELRNAGCDVVLCRLLGSVLRIARLRHSAPPTFSFRLRENQVAALWFPGRKWRLKKRLHWQLEEIRRGIQSKEAQLSALSQEVLDRSAAKDAAQVQTLQLRVECLGSRV